MPTIRNIIIFLVIGGGISWAYFVFMKPNPNDSATLVSSSGAPLAGNAIKATSNEVITQDFLNLLLSVKNIKLDSAIFNDPAFVFMSKHDSSITLTPDGNEGRINPFAPLGSDPVLPPTVIPAVVPPTVPVANPASDTTPTATTGTATTPKP